MSTCIPVQRVNLGEFVTPYTIYTVLWLLAHSILEAPSPLHHLPSSSIIVQLFFHSSSNNTSNWDKFPESWLAHAPFIWWHVSRGTNLSCRLYGYIAHYYWHWKIFTTCFRSNLNRPINQTLNIFPKLFWRTTNEVFKVVTCVLDTELLDFFNLLGYGIYETI